MVMVCPLTVNVPAVIGLAEPARGQHQAGNIVRRAQGLAAIHRALHGPRPYPVWVMLKV